MIKWALTLAVVLACATASHTVNPGEPPAWREPYVYDLTRYVEPSDCKVRGCNLTPAIKRAMTACEKEIEGAESFRALTGCVFQIPAGDHQITETISTCRAHTFIGRGGQRRRPNTSIAAKGMAFHGRSLGECSGPDSLAGALTLSGFALVFPAGSHESPIVAIKAEARISVEDVWILNPDVGVWITADLSRSTPSNANQSHLEGVTTEYTRHAGIIFQGGDANAGTAIGVSVNAGCRAHDTPEGARLDQLFGPCGGYVDRSFLGNFAVGGHFAVAEGAPDFAIVGRNNHGTCLGCYVEGDTPPALEARFSQWIGGLGPAPEGPGFRLDGDRTTRLRVVNDADPENRVTFAMGRNVGASGGYYALQHESNNLPLRMRWDTSNESYVEDLGNLKSATVRSIVGAKDENDRSQLGRSATPSDDAAPPSSRQAP